MIPVSETLSFSRIFNRPFSNSIIVINLPNRPETTILVSSDSLVNLITKSVFVRFPSTAQFPSLHCALTRIASCVTQKVEASDAKALSLKPT